MRLGTASLLGLLFPVSAFPARAFAAPQNGDTVADSWTIHAERVYTSTGDILQNAVVRVSDGRIAALRPGRSAPKDAVRAVAVTAGMIDLSPRLHAGFASVEQSREIQPHLAVTPSVDLWDRRWEPLARSGVTTVLVSPMDRNVIGGQAVAVKTAGPEELATRLVESRGVVRGAIGTEPSSGNHPAFGRPTDFYARRPTTRMGVEWEWRKAYFDAVAALRLPEREFPGAADLRATLAGEKLLMIQAWATQDIRTAVYLKEEMAREGFGEIELVIDAAAEAWKEPDLLVRTGTTVVLPPHTAGGRTRDSAFLAWDSAKRLTDLGITVCLSAHGNTSPSGSLGRQAGHAMRGGLRLEQALEAVTLAPARLLGIDDRVGSVAEGLDADLVLWSGTPFEATSRVVGVLVDGELVLDPRTATNDDDEQ